MAKVPFFISNDNYVRDQYDLFKHFNITLACQVFTAMDCRVKSAHFYEEKGQMIFEVTWAMTQDYNTVVLEYCGHRDEMGHIHIVKAWEIWANHPDRPDRANEVEGHNLCEAIVELVKIWDRG